MITTIANIGTEINELISKSKPIYLTEEEKINRFLDAINKTRDNVVEQTQFLIQLDKLLTKITWSDLISKDEESILLNIVDESKTLHHMLIIHYVRLVKVLHKKNVCKKEILSYKIALDDFEDSVFEVEQIFFSFRKDKEIIEKLNAI